MTLSPGEISDLLARGSIIQTDRPPLVVNPLNVVEHNSKLRLVLGLVYVNHFIKKEGLKFKYEGIKLTSLYCTWQWGNQFAFSLGVYMT